MTVQAPWPAALGTALWEPGTNRSLLFDRGFREFKVKGDGLEIPPGEKTSFLHKLTELPGELVGFLARRQAAMKALGAFEIPLISQTPLVVGLGLPSPLETGFLFDRLTGCPYLPGSSVKGLARATARLVAKGELSGDDAYWRGALERSFGPFGDGEAGRRKGRLNFYDALPSSWPRFSVDVLTPHYGAYYRDPKTPPGDWEDPVPVPFLAIQAGAIFSFWVGSSGAALSEEERGQIRELFVLGLDWLAIGGKRSQGYGAFGTEAVAQPMLPTPAPKAVNAKKPTVEEPRRPTGKGGFGAMASGKNLAELSKVKVKDGSAK